MANSTQTLDDSSGRGYDISQWYDSKPVKIGWLPMLGIGATGQCFWCNIISAITNTGALAVMVFQGQFKAPVFVAFLQQLLKQVVGKIYLIVGGHSVHKSREATRFPATRSAQLRLIRMPGCCQELNLDELLIKMCKPTGLARAGRLTRPNS